MRLVLAFLMVAGTKAAIETVLAEMIDWLDRYVKNPREPAATP